MRRLALCMIASAIMLAGCGPDIGQMMASTHGRHIDTVIAEWGPPSSIVEMPPDRIMTWQAVRHMEFAPATFTTGATQPGILQNGVVTTYTPPVASNYVVTRTFWVNSQGIIFKTAWRGQ